MNTETVLRNAVKGTLALASVGFLTGIGTAYAQPAPVAATKGSARRLSRIVVTGSHIPQTAIATAQPVLTIDRQQLQATGFQTIGQVLQNMSAVGPSLSTQVNNGGNGGELVNLHDLGPQRVLVLVNGQRWVSQLSGAVDLSSIPLSVVSRIEVLLDGASAVYGSEAIAGVINIITVKNYKGAEAHAYFGGYDAHSDGGGWDGKTQQYSFTIGNSGKHSGVLLSAGYYQQLPVWASNRTISKEPRIGTGNTHGSSGSLGGRFRVDLGGFGIAPSGCGTTSCDISGPDPNDPSGFHKWTSADKYNFSPANYLLTPSERWYVFSQGHYDLSDNVTFHFTTTYRRRNSVELLAADPIFFGAARKETANGLKIGVAKDAPGNPFGVDLVPYSSAASNFPVWCQKFGSSTCSTQHDLLVFAGRRPLEVGNRVYSRNVQTFYFNGGFEGDFALGNNLWNWDVNYVYSQSFDTNIQTGRVDTAKLQKALSESCASLPGCVPINLFGGIGSISPAAAKYVAFTGHDVTDAILRDYNGGIYGNFFNHWYAGAWGLAAGYEYEGLSGFYQPDAVKAQGNVTGGGAAQPTSGAENTNAEYAELKIPFAKNLFLAQDLNVDLAERYSQFHWHGVGNLFNSQGSQITGTGSVGEYAHSATPRVTITWQPVHDLLLRGTWAQGFRIPSLSELFGGAHNASVNLVDPCALDPATNPRSSLPPGCNGNFHVQPNGQIQTTVGGNAQLEPEKATTRTAGFVYSPSQVRGLDISADYYKTEITDVIQTVGSQFYLNDCFINQDPASCGHIALSGTGDQTTVVNIVNLLENGGSRKVEGWDVRIRYQFPTFPFGNLQLALTGNFNREDAVCHLNGVCQDMSGTAGPTSTGFGSAHYAIPRKRYDFHLNWNYGPWDATWNISVLGPMYEDCTQSNANGNQTVSPGFCSDVINLASNGRRILEGINRLGTTVYNDIQASYTVDAWNTTFTLGADNIFDKAPPVGMASKVNFYQSPYRIPGRFIYGRISVQF